MIQKEKEFCNEQFEKDCLANFEKLLQGYRKAKQINVWEDNLDALVDKVTQLPTDPFSSELMNLFNYYYLVLSEDINSLIEKSLEVRELLKPTERFVTIDEKYYNIPFIPSNTHIKRLEIRNNENEICYLQKGRLSFNFKHLFPCINPFNRKYHIKDLISIKQKVLQDRELELYYYSHFVDLSTISPQNYYDFYCDYYSRIQLINYVNSKGTVELIPGAIKDQPKNIFESVLGLTSAQRVLWSYFMFRVLGLKLHINLDIAILTRFVHVLHNLAPDEYRNYYYYTLAKKLPYIKGDKSLLKDLEVVRLEFKKYNLPTNDIEKEIEMLAKQ
jgi:hypothetical protein